MAQIWCCCERLDVRLAKFMAALMPLGITFVRAPFHFFEPRGKLLALLIQEYDSDYEDATFRVLAGFIHIRVEFLFWHGTSETTWGLVD